MSPFSASSLAVDIRHQPKDANAASPPISTDISSTGAIEFTSGLLIPPGIYRFVLHDTVNPLIHATAVVRVKSN